MTLMTPQEVLLDWALAEACSPRWRQEMMEGLSVTLARKLDEKAWVFSAEEKRELISRLEHRRKDKIDGYIKPFQRFRIVSLPVELLESLPVSPQVGGWKNRLSLGRFIDGIYSDDTFHDPRNAAKRLLENPDPAPYAGHPIVSYSQKLNCSVLIEGYARCISAVLRRRAGEVVPPITVIQCVRGK